MFKLIKKNNKTLGLCHGVFDLLHYGHLLHFEAAKKKCDYLFVSITSDQYVNKGPNRPTFDEENRLKALAALNSIDYVVLSENPNLCDNY